jgi:hypothetical protein
VYRRFAGTIALDANGPQAAKGERMRAMKTDSGEWAVEHTLKYGAKYVPVQTYKTREEAEQVGQRVDGYLARRRK